MASRLEGGDNVHHSPLDFLAWPVAAVSPLVWPVVPWASWLWEHAPTPTALYMVISAAFMLFQMCDKMVLLERFKRHHKELPDLPDAPEDDHKRHG